MRWISNTKCIADNRQQKTENRNQTPETRDMTIGTWVLVGAGAFESVHTCQSCVLKKARHCEIENRLHTLQDGNNAQAATRRLGLS